MSIGLRYAARSDIGRVRKGNEDSGYASGNLLIVADGMGGHAAGELASTAAVATLAQVADMPLEDPGHTLRDAVYLAEDRLAEFIDRDPSTVGMGTTLTALALSPVGIVLAHVGDSRAYRFRDGTLEQLTRDHTYVQTLVDSGEITAEEAKTHPRRNLLTKAIDGTHPVDPDVAPHEVQVGDRYLLCSDGLTGVVDESVIAQVLESHDLTLAVETLVEEALVGGAPDNVTVVVAEIVDLQQPYSGEATVVGAAREPRNRQRLPGLQFPSDVDQDYDQTGPDGIPVIEAPIAEPAAAAPVTAPATPATFRVPFWKPILGVICIGLVLASLAGVWLSNQWYVGESDGKVAIYQGIPQHLFGMPLSDVSTVTDVSVDSVATIWATSVKQGISASSQADAERIAGLLRLSATECAKVPTPEGCPPVTPDGTATPSPSASASASPAPSKSGF